jgi:glycosyltransferase involved in cell wall biosynthesis
MSETPRSQIQIAADVASDPPGLRPIDQPASRTRAPGWPARAHFHLGAEAATADPERRYRLYLIAATVAFILIYVLAYAVLISPIFEKSGLVNRLPADGSIVLAMAMAALPALWLPVAANRPSDAALWVVYLTGYVPSLIVPAYLLGSGWSLAPLWLVTGGSFTLVTILVGGVRIRIPQPAVTERVYPAILGVVAAVLVTGVLVWFGLPSGIPDLTTVASTRDEYREALDSAGSAAGYAVLWTAQVVAPLLIAYGIWSHRRLMVAAGGLLFLLVWSLTAFRSLIFVAVLLVGLIVLVGRWRRWFGIILPILVSGIVVLSAAAAAAGWLLPASLVVRRLLVSPGQVMAYYYDFFSKGPVYELSHSILHGIVPQPYLETPPALIGRLYLGDARTYANGNLWADGMANFGLLGIVGASLVFALILVALNTVSRGRPATITIPIAALGLWRVTNTGLLTSLASHGLGLMLLLLWLLPWGRRRTARTQPATVAHLTSVHRANDPRIYLKECRTLAAAGFDVTLIGRGTPPTTRSDVRFISVGDTGSRGTRMIVLPLRILRAAWRLKADVYHIHDPELIPVAMMLKARGARVIYDVHEDLPRQVAYKAYVPRPLRRVASWFASFIDGLAGLAFDGIVTVTPYIASRFPARKTIVVANFPLLDEFASHTATPYRDRPPLVAYVGRLTPEVGGLVMAQAARIVGSSRACRFVVAGPGGDAVLAEMHRRVAPVNLETPGWLDRDAVTELLGSASVGLAVFQPMDNYTRAYPTKLFEYMAAAIPVVASAFPMYREVVLDHDAGILVDPTDPSAVARAIEELLDDPARAAAMGERGRQAVVARYNWEAGSANLVAFYHEQIARLDAEPDDIVRDGRVEARS